MKYRLRIFFLLTAVLVFLSSLSFAHADELREAADNSTTLADGCYTADHFAFSGGTGKVKISCKEIIVLDGHSYAAIQFSSSSYSYVKAAGETYYAEIKDGKAEFTIPVVLNANNRILGMTTKMSTPHEIEYTLFIELKSADMSELSDSIMPEPILLEHAKLLQMQKMGSAVMVEIDTGRMSEENTQAAEADMTPADYTAQIYRNRAVKYIICDEGTDLPAGMEKEYIPIFRPVQVIYTASDAASKILTELGCQDRICMQGNIGDVSYRALLQQKVQLAIGDESALPHLSGDAADRFAALGIPVLLDLSGLEENPEASEDWNMLYKLLMEVTE